MNKKQLIENFNKYYNSNNLSWIDIKHAIVNDISKLEDVEDVEDWECLECKNNNIEFGQVVGTLGWAYEEAKANGSVYHENKRYLVINDYLCLATYNGCGDRVQVSNYYLTGWSRKPETDKEKLIGKIFDDVYKWDEYTIGSAEFIDHVGDCLEKCEIKLK